MGDWKFEKEDFLTTTPYEELYKTAKNPFVHAAMMEELTAYAKSQGFQAFKGMYKQYVAGLKAQNDTVYINNVTEFSNQPIQ